MLKKTFLTIHIFLLISVLVLARGTIEPKASEDLYDFIDYCVIYGGSDTKVEAIKTNMKETVVVNLTPNYTILIDKPDESRIGEKQNIKIYVGPFFNPNNSMKSFAEAKLKIGTNETSSREENMEFLRTFLVVPEDGIIVGYSNVTIKQLDESLTGRREPWDIISQSPGYMYAWQDLDGMENRFFKEVKIDVDYIKEYLAKTGIDLVKENGEAIIKEVFGSSNVLKAFTIVSGFAEAIENNYDKKEKMIQELELSQYDHNQYDVEEFYWEDANSIFDMDGKISNNFIITIPITYEKRIDDTIALNILLNFDMNTRDSFKVNYKFNQSTGQQNITTMTSSKENDYDTSKVIESGDMVLVRGGTFNMGDELVDLGSSCRPVHEVTLTYDYWMGKHEVTFENYDTYCEMTGISKPDDRGWGRENRPVINVSWWDVITYCNWLSDREGLPRAYDIKGNLMDSHQNITTDISKVKGYRLPTEAEWEFAARGGNRTKYDLKYSGSDYIGEVAWYDNISGSRTQPVGTKKANALGIYDMSGNIWEWCHDYWGDSYYSNSPVKNPVNTTSSSYRIIRGGNWYYDAVHCRVAARSGYAPSSSYSVVGFRIVRTK